LKYKIVLQFKVNERKSFLVAVSSYKDSIADAFLVDMPFELVEKMGNKSTAVHYKIEYEVFFRWICADVVCAHANGIIDVVLLSILGTTRCRVLVLHGDDISFDVAVLIGQFAVEGPRTVESLRWVISFDGCF